MGCGCNNGNANIAFLERFFGRQIYGTPTLDRIDRIGQTDPVYFPTNVLGFDYELGFNGYRYATSMPNVGPQFTQPGYGGILPLDQQPKMEMPFPYDVPVVV